MQTISIGYLLINNQYIFSFTKMTTLLSLKLRGTSLELPCVFFLFVSRSSATQDVILNILDSGYIQVFDITEKPSLAYTVRTQ